MLDKNTICGYVFLYYLNFIMHAGGAPVKEETRATTKDDRRRTPQQ